MKFTLQKVSDNAFAEEIEVNSLEDMQALQEKYRRELIVNFDSAAGPIIVVYDDYQE